MTVRQPFQYQGSQRALAPLILQYLPISTTRLAEPFCGSAAGWRSAAVPGGGFRHRPGARFWNWRRDAAATRRRGRLRYGLTMTVPQPIQYQGSQRALAPLILQSLPISTTRPVRVAQPSPAAGSSTVPVRVSGTAGKFATRGGTPLLPAGGDACATSCP